MITTDESVQWTPDEIARARHILNALNEGTMISWIMDSDASKHMCNDQCMFTSLVLHCAKVEYGYGECNRIQRNCCFAYSMGLP